MPTLGKINPAAKPREARLIDQNFLSQRVGVDVAGYFFSLLLKLDTSLMRMRKSKKRLGVFRADNRIGQCRIAIRWDLDDDLLVLVLCHEIGHAMVWRAYGRKAKAHGSEWKFAMQQILSPLTAFYFFSEKWQPYSNQLMLKPSATYNEFEVQELDANFVFIKDIPENGIFLYKNKRFSKGPLRRTRFLCECISNRRKYAFDAHVAVIQL